MEDNTQEINQSTGERQRYGNCERILMRNQGQNETLDKYLIGGQEDDFRENASDYPLNLT